MPIITDVYAREVIDSLNCASESLNWTSPKKCTSFAMGACEVIWRHAR